MGPNESYSPGLIPGSLFVLRVASAIRGFIILIRRGVDIIAGETTGFFGGGLNVQSGSSFGIEVMDFTAISRSENICGFGSTRFACFFFGLMLLFIKSSG